jgi:hypothetical protein
LALNDWTLLDRLGGGAVPAARRLIERLMRRDLLKRGYVISAASVEPETRAALVRTYHEVRPTRGGLEAALASELGCAEGELIVYCPALTVMKEAAARVVTRRGLRALNAADDPGSAEIRALEERYANLWRLYVFVPGHLAERAAAAAAAHLGHASEYTPPRP